MTPAAIARCRTKTDHERHRRALPVRRAPPARSRTAACTLLATVVLPFLALAAAPSLAADERPTGGRVPTVTRLVALYLEREGAVSDAIRDGNESALANLLTADFELRAGARAAAPVPRAEWMREVLRTRDAGENIRSMAVHDYGTVAVVSFAMNAKPGAVFVVDVWRVEGAEPKLSVRYASPAGTSQFAIPGAGAAEPGIPKKY
jgi:hypothetical protein